MTCHNKKVERADSSGPQYLKQGFMELYIHLFFIFLDIYVKLTVQIVFSESSIEISPIFFNFSDILSFIQNELW